jgi:hypothetical protein
MHRDDDITGGVGNVITYTKTYFGGPVCWSRPCQHLGPEFRQVCSGMFLNIMSVTFMSFREKL